MNPTSAVGPRLPTVAVGVRVDGAATQELPMLWLVILLAAPAGQRVAPGDDMPQHLLPGERPLWIDRHPVTCEQYARFLNEVQPDPRRRFGWIAILGEEDDGQQPCDIDVDPNAGFVAVRGREQEPVTQVSLRGATAYASWQGRRLPSADEHRAAAEQADRLGLLGFGELREQCLDRPVDDDATALREDVTFRTVQSAAEGELQRTRSGLRYVELAEGDGPYPRHGQTLVVHYTGWTEEGVKFDSSLDRGESFGFRLGEGMVIAGWDEGLAAMRPGGRRRLILPSHLAYGERGIGEAIPPRAALVFEVTLIAVQ